VFPDTPVANFVHLVELTLENNKFSSFLGLSVYHTLFKLLKSVNNLEEVAVI
jgi:hypothetical protein